MFSIVMMKMVSQVHTNIKSYLTVHFKHMLCIVHKLYSKQTWTWRRESWTYTPQKEPRGWTYPLFHALVGVVCDFGDEGQRA